jgi:hypothetical protein
MKHFCKKHKTLLGCIVAGLLFIALHIGLPAVVAGGVAHHAHAGVASREPLRTIQTLKLDNGIVVHRIRDGIMVCFVAVASGKMAKTVDMECY